MTIEEFLVLFVLWVLATIIGLVLTGILADRFVIRKIMQNEDVQDFIKLFREGKQYLKEILENQRKRSRIV